MEVKLEQANGSLRFIFIPESEDSPDSNEKFRMASRECEFRLPDDVTIDEIHPDHLALVSLMLCFPFVGKNLTLSWPVSEKFLEGSKIISRFVVRSTDGLVGQFEPPSDSIPALAFSGGVDSVTALAVMPKDTVGVFLDRPIRGRSLYDKDAPRQICRNLSGLGHSILMVESDLEYLRDPVGFPVDVANSSPAVLLANKMGFDSIAFGTIMESAYKIGHRKYLHYPDGNHNKLWGSLFKAAGIPLNLVVAGMSEVCTSVIMINHEIGSYSQSCIRGKWMAPCMNCWKCFRKTLLDLTIRGDEISDGLLDEMFQIQEARIHLTGFPIKHENVLTYITARYEGGHDLMGLLKRRVGGDKSRLEWLEFWNPESIEIL